MPAAERSVEAEIVRRVSAEYQEMPGLSLTMPQAAYLLGLSPDVCASVLEALVRQGVLRRTMHGRFILAR